MDFLTLTSKPDCMRTKNKSRRTLEKEKQFLPRRRTSDHRIQWRIEIPELAPKSLVEKHQAEISQIMTIKADLLTTSTSRKLKKKTIILTE